MNGSRQNIRRRIAKAALLLFALPAAYLLAALAGSLIPANPGWAPPRDGVTIFVRTNGVHTWVMVPAATPEIDWRPLVPATHLRDPRYAGDYLAMGWGSREFYLETPRWSDLSAGTAFRALFGNGPTLMHVDHEFAPAAAADQRPVTLSHEQYRRLAGFIRASFADGDAGAPTPLLGTGYGRSDIFYFARGRYNLFRTSNEWTGAALRAAGVRMGVWTPFSASVMGRFDPPA